MAAPLPPPTLKELQQQTAAALLARDECLIDGIRAGVASAAKAGLSAHAIQDTFRYNCSSALSHSKARLEWLCRQAVPDRAVSVTCTSTPAVSWRGRDTAQCVMDWEDNDGRDGSVIHL